MSSMPSWSRPGNPVQPTRLHRANAWLAAVAVLAACLGGLGAAYGFAQISHGTPVLVVARTVLQGAVIQTSDLAVVEVTAPNAPVVLASQRDAVAGTRALTTLPAGALLAPHSFGQPRLGDGLAQVQLRLGPTQVPSGPLPGGQTLILIGLPGADDTDGLAQLIGARVVYPPVDQIDGTVVIDVAVAAADVSLLAPYLLDRRVVAVVPS